MWNQVLLRTNGPALKLDVWCMMIAPSQTMKLLSRWYQGLKPLLWNRLTIIPWVQPWPLERLNHWISVETRQLQGRWKKGLGMGNVMQGKHALFPQLLVESQQLISPFNSIMITAYQYLHCRALSTLLKTPSLFCSPKALGNSAKSLYPHSLKYFISWTCDV